MFQFEQKFVSEANDSTVYPWKNPTIGKQLWHYNLITQTISAEIPVLSRE